MCHPGMTEGHCVTAGGEDNHNPRGLHTVLNLLLENCSAWERRQPGHPGPIRFPGKSASA